MLGDFAKYNFMFEGIASIAEIISRYAIVESLYLNHASEASGVRTEIERALVTLYAAVLVLLAKTNSYFDQNTAGSYQRTQAYIKLISMVSACNQERIW